MAESSATILQALQPGGALTGALTGAAAIYGLIQLSSALSGGPKPQSQVYRQSRPVKWRAYGECRTAGPLAFFGTKTSNNRLFMVVMTHYGQMDSIISHWFGDEQLGLVGGDGDPETTDADVVVSPAHFRDGGRWCRIDARYGTDNQTSFKRLTDELPAKWTTNHKLAGISAVLVNLLSPESKDFDSVFNHGLPAYSQIGRYSKVFDPRKSAHNHASPATWEYSKNLALCTLDYLTNHAGMDLPWDLFSGAMGTTNPTDWGTQANICDEVMALKSGGTEPRYEISGGYELTERPVDVLSRMLNVADARLMLRGDGYVGLDVAKFYEPTVTLTDVDILDWSGFQRSKDPSEIKNVIAAKYIAPDQNYEETDADPWYDEDSIAANGEHQQQLDLTFARSHSAARRRMKIERYRGDPEWSGTIVTNANGMRCWGERSVRIDSTRHGFNAVFEIVEFSSFNPLTGNCTLNISAMPVAATNWVPSVDEGTAPVSDSYSDNSGVELPVNFAVVGGAGVMNATWNAPADSGVNPIVQRRSHNDAVGDESATWTAFPTIDKAARTAASGTVSAGTYDARMKFDGGMYVFVRSIVVS